MKYIVLGLGHFGKSLAIHLTELGHEVIGADKNLTIVEQLKDRVTHTVCMDTTDRDSVSALPLRDSHAVIVAIGEDEGASMLTTALLKQLHVKRIIGRVVSDLQKTVMEAMEIDEYIMPEEEAAERLAMRLDNIDIVDSFKISDKYSIVETKVPAKYIGMTLEQANLTNSYGVIVLTTVNQRDVLEKGKNVKIKEATGIAKSDTMLREEDLLVLFGELSNIKKLIQKGE
ncbi:potassium channel family protein [Sphingobacterium spiritivorum]|uniref:TrkA N-terminal domain protein n=1 Tax=Sphingobacterium spiritivorum ATCC 33861 TaxID=525373 RepID=D7VLP1_SPHSI|nr:MULTISPECIES: TrkA family potassium uptake protein [Sphingobacterium]EFK58514.1 TrkA N-terminal domain protein [Sphingobacterium spiritivorum ATCC 33861]QQT27484.1 TrkA family potassium uptake protein [Sphingobacterium spiritivorum]QQT37248.1 TrkA family potassium uptake protein [Sphingobacterium spiritivorum]WQD34030.1 TrkA family potassium uptake protein [Sphingobacterium spiritivorum]SUJ29277.1 Ktr system potassium uptake protein A [Sphingobacterium spiritivorum]